MFLLEYILIIEISTTANKLGLEKPKILLVDSVVFFYRNSYNKKNLDLYISRVNLEGSKGCFFIIDEDINRPLRTLYKI
jgi:hypothetical protein